MPCGSINFVVLSRYKLNIKKMEVKLCILHFMRMQIRGSKRGQKVTAGS